ncbi:MAG: exodeoxyribonuclease VII large subunit [Rhodocyclales bacterium]|nr:exodeoxyribonuclease VII large subunit [Rhodocyclales bacterium]
MPTDANAIIPVSELNRRVRLALEGEFPLQWVAGEISNLTRAASGHVYFSLKDETAQARCVMFRSRAQAIPWRLENGQQVEARALVSLYEPRGDFQLGVESLRRAGLGRLFEAFARLRERLEAEGMFASQGKRPLPSFPRTIGIIASPQAAALRDVLAAIRRRAPHLGVILYPSLVQGEGAGERIADAITLAGKRGECDVLLVVRGGGSIEDLWAFNEECVARAIAASPLPIVSGVGHETDNTIADFVADMRAATPTAAAELATQHWFAARQHLVEQESSLLHSCGRRLDQAQYTLDQLMLRLVHPSTRLERSRTNLDLLASRMKGTLPEMLRHKQSRLDHAALALGRSVPRIDATSGRIELLARRLLTAGQKRHAEHSGRVSQLERALHHLNPAHTLARGYAVARDAKGAVISNAGMLATGQAITVQFAHGDIDASVLVARPD